jgi:hypothetical protein
VRTQKRVVAQPDIKWFKTYQWKATANGTLDDVTQLMDSVRGFEVALLMPEYEVTEVTGSTYVPDSHPYNPASFTTDPTIDVGIRKYNSYTDIPLPLRNAVYIERGLLTGRQGKLFLRGLVDQRDCTQFPSGFVLTNDSAIQSLVNAAATNSCNQLGETVGFNHGPFQLVVATNATTTRVVHTLTVKGVVDIKLNHKYFDKKTAQG